MGKAEMVSGRQQDREKWPPEAALCECIYNLGCELRKTGLMEKFMFDSSGEVAQSLCHNETIYGYLKTLSHFYSKIEQIDEWHDNCTPVHVIGQLRDLGVKLSECIWWERYEKISDHMGTDCILCLKTAESMFKNEKHIAEVRSIIKDLSAMIDKLEVPYVKVE